MADLSRFFFGCIGLEASGNMGRIEHETRQQHWATDVSRSMCAGILAKVCVNNLNRTVARYQVLGQIRPDLRLSSATSQLFGASLQSLGVYQTRAVLGVSDSMAMPVLDFSKNFMAGVVGGLLMHPCCVPFFYLPAEKYKTGFLPSLAAFKGILKKNPQVFARGVLPRGISTGLEFGVYFSAKQALQHTIESPWRLEIASSLPAIMLSMPFHQMYIQALNTEPSQILNAQKPIFQSMRAISSRHIISFLLFTAINGLELAVLDGSEKGMAAISSCRGDTQ